MKIETTIKIPIDDTVHQAPPSCTYPNYHLYLKLQEGNKKSLRLMMISWCKDNNIHYICTRFKWAGIAGKYEMFTTILIDTTKLIDLSTVDEIAKTISDRKFITYTRLVVN